VEAIFCADNERDEHSDRGAKVRDQCFSSVTNVLIGDFGAAVVREVGVHDSVFIAQTSTPQWNAN
jgi:hypothetical protein